MACDNAPEPSASSPIPAVPVTPLCLPENDLAEELLRREPVFDRVEVIWDEASFEAEIAPDFREIGASGRCYERDEIKRIVLGRLTGTHAPSLIDGYRIEGAELVRLSADIVQVRYTLHGQGRRTRRSTLYRRGAEAWQAVFHQGTVVADDASAR